MMIPKMLRYAVETERATKNRDSEKRKNKIALRYEDNRTSTTEIKTDTENAAALLIQIPLRPDTKLFPDLYEG